MVFKTFLLLIGLLMVSAMEGFGQTAPSAHPLMDKYYPRPQKEIPEKNQTPGPVVTTANPAPVVATAPPANNEVQARPKVTPTVTQAPEPELPTTSAVTNTPITVDTTNTTTTSSTSMTNPASVTVTTPAQKVVPKAPPPPPYMDTRLGSSSPQYDTWEKNNNGAGSVTTSPKQ